MHTQEKHRVCRIDSDGLYIGQVEISLPLPENCITAAPPEKRDGYAACWNSKSRSWHYLPDYRGRNAYRNDNGATVLIGRVGTLPEWLSLEAPPHCLHKQPPKAEYHFL